MDGKSPLGAFLRARRQVTTVDQVGLPNIGSRRTPGLRRDEVALLAGVSADYYIRLEQGRERNPSDQVLDALARVFRLDAEATQHLHDLARHRASRHGPVGPYDWLRPYVLQFIEGCDHAVAFALNRRLDILVKNPLASALYHGLDDCDNLLRLIFLNPVAREFYLDWRQQAEDVTGHFRAALGTGGDDPFVQDLVEELSHGSEDFQQIWARHEVRTRTHWSISYRHGVVGEITLHYEMFRVGSPTAQQLVVGQAEPYTSSERAFRRLGRLAGSPADRH
ncbi:helix-turn-helix transcriptional regulator [Planotetraspora phitsanulokensis]|uniref:Transcriptional regulator n=1 Tax=Planotetraspora phitsanulokensis TaxID=575192 RepID=A0A8J3UCQ5_9ACTN|nr:helix-turn-helix transcriptional regulator [Planotetraspora phitsanulokensis]GII41232.1 transcriptional regulator [Planotetraspora phitsanulokensis]